MAGRLIGINTSILTRSGGSNGIGFAIPADLVAAFVEQANAGNSRFLRPWAGVTGQLLDADMAETFGFDRPGGIIISDLHAASPFGAAGFTVGDVITAVDGQAVNTAGEMIFRMSVAGLGNSSVVTRIRKGTVEDIPVELMLAPEIPARDPLVLGKDAILTGLELARINPAVISELNLSFNAEGVVVMKPGPIAPRVGLKIGDVIETINGEAITSAQDVSDALMASGRGVSIMVIRAGSRVRLRFRL
jgi:S1-C subfamily serine protease